MLRNVLRVACSSTTQNNLVRNLSLARSASVGALATKSGLRWLRTSTVDFVKGIEVKMPSLSPTMTEGTIIKWHKKEGDKIEPGEVVCEIQTDKAVVAYEMEDEAILAKILVKEDSKDIKIGTLIALLVEEGEDWKEVEIPSASEATSSVTASSGVSESSAAPATRKEANEHSHGRPQLLGPSVRNLLQQYGLSASDIKATGPHEALLKGDVLNYISQNNIKPSSLEETSSQASKPKAAGRRIKPAKFVDIETSNMRKIIAKRLTESKTTIPHSYMTADCNVNKVVNERKDMKNRGINVSVNDFIIKAAGVSLKKNPQVNVSWDESSLSVVHSPTVDISIAVATPNGLITPIVQNANALSTPEISEKVRELAGRAKVGKLLPHEFQGGSFSISNLGMFGVSEFSAVINPPQAAILAIGTSRLVVSDKGDLEQRMAVTLSYDARAVSDESAAKFLETFTELINEPSSLEGSAANRQLHALIN